MSRGERLRSRRCQNAGTDLFCQTASSKRIAFQTDGSSSGLSVRPQEMRRLILTGTKDNDKDGIGRQRR